MPKSRKFMEHAEDAPEPDLLSRSDARRAQRELEEALARLAKDLAEIRPRWLEQLDLPESVLDAVTDARAIQSPPAQNRQLRLVRTALRDADWSLIRAQVDALNKHGALPAKLARKTPSPASRAPEWVARLLGEGATAVEALVQVAPKADRTHLKNLVREVHKASAERRKKAEERLKAAVASALE